MPEQAQKPFEPLYSLAHLTLLGCSATELVYIAARAGYDAISPRFIPMNVPGEFSCYPEDKDMVAAMKNALKITGIKVLELELARITEDCVPKSFIPAFELGAELGAKRMMCSAWTKVRDDRNFIIDCYAEICEIAAGYGMSVDLEFPTFSRLRNLDETLDIVRAADQPNSGILVDTLYMHLSRVDKAEILHVPSKYFHFIQISDALPGIADTREGLIQLARDARLYPGEGCIDFKGVVERMPPVDYAIELPNKSRLLELGYEEHARRCLIHTKKMLENVHSKRQIRVGDDEQPSRIIGGVQPGKDYETAEFEHTENETMQNGGANISPFFDNLTEEYDGQRAN